MRRAIIYLFFSLFCFGIFFAQVAQAVGPTKIWYFVDKPVTWTKENSPYIVMNHVVVTAPLTIDAGTVVKFALNSMADLTIQNNFVVKGTREEPVVFTSYRDDSFMGDTNKDGSNTKPNQSDWVGLNFNPYDDKTLDIKYAKIMYSGFGISIYSSNNHYKNRTVKNCELKNNGYGIVIYNAEPVIENNLITDNQFGVRVYASSKITKITNNSIYGNETGAEGDNETNPGLGALDARYNWWGDKNGPKNANNPGGGGDKIVGKVLFDPWIREDPIQTPDPVIIIPGIMGSWEVNGEWKIEPMLHTYDNLYEEFADNGYVPEQNLFTFPYEWRDSNKVNAIELKGKIQQIKDQTHRPKVDIVAHSMGGLLAREYIENNYYQNDVDQLITLGTPHLGAPKAYLMWEAGEFGIHFEDYILKRIFSREAEKAGYDNLFHYVRSRITSTEELLPVYDYLYDLDLNSLRLYPNNYPQNMFLENLNSVEKLSRLDQIEFDVIYGKIEKENTVIGFKVINKPTSGDYWEHGYPKDFNNLFGGENGIEYGPGDETVPISSANTLNSNYKFEVSASHNQIPTEAQQDILELLTGKRPSGKVTSHGISIKDILLIQIYCPIDIQVTSPSGKVIGTDFLSGEEINEIPGATYIKNSDDEEFITIPNPEEGKYKILTQGTGSGEYKIETTKISEDENDPQGAKESTAIITGTAQIGKTEEAKIEVSENEVVYNPDTTPPTITGAATTEPNSNGWYDHDVTIHFEASDAESGIKSVTPDIILSTEGENQPAEGEAIDKAGNRATFTVSNINIDKTPPSISGVATSLPNENGWYKGDVAVKFTCADSLSGPVRTSFDSVISTEGLNQSMEGICEDLAGNNAALKVSGINIDKTAPAITISSPKKEEYLNNQILPINYTITDNLTQQDKIVFTTTSCSENVCDENFSKPSIDLSLEHLGNHEFKVTATDEAGNLSQAETNFTSKTSLDAIQNNANHFWELGLLKKKFVRKYLAIRLKHLEYLFNLLEKTKNSNLKPKPKQAAIEALKRAINADIDRLIRQLNRKSPCWIDPKAAELIIEDLNFIRP